MANAPEKSDNTMNQAPVALITGAAARIGAALVRKLHQQGYRIVLHYNTSVDKAQALAAVLNKQRKDSVITVQANLLNTDEIIHLAQQAIDQWCRLDVLINNASIYYPTPVGAIQENDWINLMHSNAKAPLLLCQALAPALKLSNGCIVNIVDSTALHGLKNFTPYTMAKAALANLTHSLAKELAPHVRVNGIAPGPILWHESEAGRSEEEKTAIIKSTALQRMGSVEDISCTALFLIAQASYVTGQIIAVDGGAALTG